MNTRRCCAATCISCGAAYGAGHFSWCEFVRTDPATNYRQAA